MKVIYTIIVAIFVMFIITFFAGEYTACSAEIL